MSWQVGPVWKLYNKGKLSLVESVGHKRPKPGPSKRPAVVLERRVSKTGHAKGIQQGHGRICQQTAATYHLSC
ncbi:hypothetical protein PPACK8108_LOCUS9565 [Phakopsora pachyrhizi]|uniref:Uncharacterized protein n=1 Tax=Phakopsora pachyrhizi TaxID=170000 RepID=A0AAV0AYM4_PHAPC|nr:hypothetical protein PPACK8108_LOCUS9565 [Phakopsora pachyrhizi]